MFQGFASGAWRKLLGEALADCCAGTRYARIKCGPAPTCHYRLQQPQDLSYTIPEPSANLVTPVPLEILEAKATCRAGSLLAGLLRGISMLVGSSKTRRIFCSISSLLAKEEMHSFCEAKNHVSVLRNSALKECSQDHALQHDRLCKMAPLGSGITC